MYKLVYYKKDISGKLVNPEIVAGFSCAPWAVCNNHKKRIQETTHRSGVLKIEKI